jgi:hypothetical protein
MGLAEQLLPPEMGKSCQRAGGEDPSPGAATWRGGQSPIVERVSLETKVRGQEQKVFLSFWVCADPSDPTKAVLIFWEGERDASY